MKKIFVVEDDESICEELVQILENEGYEAESLESFDNTKDDILKAAESGAHGYQHSGYKRQKPCEGDTKGI